MGRPEATPGVYARINELNSRRFIEKQGRASQYPTTFRYTTNPQAYDAIQAEAQRRATLPCGHTGVTTITVDLHLTINDERDCIEQYNGLQWWFVFGDDNRINGIDVAHYCTGPGHTDPMGFVSWNRVPTVIQERVLETLNADTAEEVVDVEATEEVDEGVRLP